MCKVIYFGTPEISANVLEFLLKNKVNVVAVITKPDRPKGRSLEPVPTAVKAKILELSPSTPVYQPEFVSAIEFAPTLKKFDADLFVVFAYGEMIKQHLLDMPKLGCINLHASLLPKYRGAAPIQRCIMEGEKKSGVTVIHMVKKMDAGDIIKMVEVNIPADMTAGELSEELFKVGSKALLEVIHELSEGIVKRIPQFENEATFAPKVELADCELHWNLSAEKLHNLVRGSRPVPGSFCFVTVRGEKKRLKIKKTHVVSDQSGVPGEILNADKNGIVVACGDKALCITDLQLEGKKEMSIEEFLRGIPVSSLKF